MKSVAVASSSDLINLFAEALNYERFISHSDACSVKNIAYARKRQAFYCIVVVGAFVSVVRN
jgi:hypothetical protein